MKTKAISKYNVAVTVQSGKVGNVRYVQKNGQTYVRSAHNQSVNNPRTAAQMQQRLKFASLAALYKEFASVALLRNAFRRKPANQSDYNAFMQANQGQGVYFTKQQMQDGACVALPVTVSAGSLPQISAQRDNENNIVSTISVGDLDLSTATVAQVSKAIIDNNRAFKNKDVITLIILWQMSDNETSPATPWVLVEYRKIILDFANGTSFSQAYPDFIAIQGNLAFPDMDDSGCFGYVHTSGNKISKCRLTDTNAEFRSAYESDDAFETARDSYGASTEAILYDKTPGNGTSSSEGNGEDDNNGDTPSSVAAPTISGASPFALQTEVTLSAASGAAIHYTTDGSEPTSESQLYAEPFVLNSTTTVKAIAIKSGVSSEVASKTFTKSSSSNDD